MNNVKRFLQHICRNFAEGQNGAVEYKDKIARLLEINHLSVRRLGAICGMNQPKVHRMAHRKDQNVVFAIRIAETLGVSLQWLYDDEQDWPPPRGKDISELSPAERSHVLKMMADALLSAADASPQVSEAEPPKPRKTPGRRREK